MADDFVHAFLFEGSRIKKQKNRICAHFRMDSKKEGWVGIPHGGIGMGAILELGQRLHADSNGTEMAYPLHCSFRMGGAEARMNDEVDVVVETDGAKITGQISVMGAAMPYITGEIIPAGDWSGSDAAKDDSAASYIPDSVSKLQGALTPLPHYRNCFVCGAERIHPGLKRRFHFWDNTPHGPMVCAFAGFDPEDGQTILRFHQNGGFHPMVHFAVLDETMGWAGFFKAANGGVSVRLKYTLHRNVGIHEKVVFFGRGERVMGRIDKRMLFWASGCGAVSADDGRLEVVMTASGQWFAMPELTGQMRTELIPAELTRQAFAFAEALSKRGE